MQKKWEITKIVMPVHFAGQSCDMINIKKLSEKYGFKIIEDAFTQLVVFIKK